MSRRKDRERAEAGLLVRNEEIEVSRNFVNPHTKDETYECFLCGRKITSNEADKLERYARNKPQSIVSKELARFQQLLAEKKAPAKTSRICTNCYKDKVE